MSVLYFGDRQVSKELFREQLLDSPPHLISIDVETISLEERIPIGFAIAVSPEDSWYFRVFPEPDSEVALLKPLLNNPSVTKVFHNAIFDLRVFPLVCNIDETNISDTNIMARLLGFQETKLPTLARELLGQELESADILLKENKLSSMLGLPYEKVAAMCASHARATLRLYHLFTEHHSIDKEYFAVEMKVIPILIDMSLRGLKVHQGDRARLQEKLETEATFYKAICEAENFNPGSNQQTGYILAKRGSFLPFTKSRKQYKADAETLEFLDDPIASAVLGYRKAVKNLTTYIKPLEDMERIYTEYNMDAVVGRVSSSNKNMQNIPPEDRHIFMPDSGVFTEGDYSQEHLRILAYFSQDRAMLRVYEEGEYGGDIHNKTAKDLNIPRYPAKTVNYAIPYGADARTISTQTKIKDIRVCQNFLDHWFETYPDAADWIIGARETGLREGWSLPTLFGRRIKIPEEFTFNGRLNTEAMGRKSINYPMIGSDGEIMKRALIICEREKLPLSVTVHDSITLDGDCTFPVEELENISPVHIPFEVKKSARWE